MNRTIAMLTAAALLTNGCRDEHASAHHESAAAEHEHPARTSPVAPGPGELWPTDEHLRRAMTQIHTALAAAQAREAHESLASIQDRALAQAVEENVTYMIEHCRLPPQADAALHVIISRMLWAAQQLKQDPPDPRAVAALEGALQDYQHTFDHPHLSQRADQS